jgi:hypothetical protein
MKGSLDPPAIVVRAARWKSLLYFLIGLGFTVIGALMFASEHSLTMRLEALFILFVFGPCVALFGWQLVRPGQLVISPDGILLRQLWRTVRWTWREVDNFRVVPLGPTTQQVGFDYAESFDKQRRLRAINAAVAGVEASLGGGWELSATKLCELLIAARAKWV